MRYKTHLANVDGSIYCSAGGRWADLLGRTNKISEVTCKRCLRRFHRLPITKKVDL